MRQDIGLFVKQEMAGWATVWGLRHENLVLLLLRRKAGREKRSALSLSLGILPYLLTVLTCYFMARWLLQQTAADESQRLALTSAAIALGIGTHWVFVTLHSTARRGLGLLALPGELGRSEEALVPAELLQLDSRSILFGLARTLLPQIWRAMAVAALLGWLTIRTYNEFQLLLISDTPAHAQSSLLLPSMAWSWFWLALFAVPGSLIFLLWLVIMGRGLNSLWQYHAICLVAALSQLAWIPLAYYSKTNWSTITGDDFIDNSIAPLMMSLLAMALFLAVLIASRRRPAQRLAISLAVPAFAIVLLIISNTIWANLLGSASTITLYKTHIWLSNLAWALSAFAVLNPFVLPAFAFNSAGVDLGMFHPAFYWYRMPSLILLQLFYLIILLYVALQAVDDWRMSED